MTPFSHEVLSLVNSEGVTSAAVAEKLIARHPNKSPVWVRNYTTQMLAKFSRWGGIERQGNGRETLYARARAR